MTGTKLSKTHSLYPSKGARAFATRVLEWYSDCGRHNLPWRKCERTEFELVVTEILLQRTRAETVASRFDEFFSRVRTWDDIIDIPYERLEEVLRPFGMWREKSRVLKSLASEMVKRGGVVPITVDEVRALPGVGHYIGAAICTILHGKAEPMLDGNMARVIERHFGRREKADIRADENLNRVASEIISSGPPVQLNWALLDHATLVCKPRRPLCIGCPVRDTCVAYRKTPRERARK